jgi:enoyl-CoA hydratase/carnithine racemase
MTQQDLLVHREGPVLTLTINRPDQRNALSPAVLEGIQAQLESANRDRELRAIVLTAVGEKAFCAGADLGTGKLFAFDYSEPRLPLPDLFRLARRTNVPIVGRINGTCMAGGMGLLAICDLAVAADHALFGLPEVKVGVYPMQVLSVLQHIVARRRLLQLCFTGEPVSAAQALDMGLVGAVVPGDQLDAAVATLVGQLIDRTPSALRRGKYATYAIESMSFEESLAFMEGQVGLLAATEDAAEGLAAFREKRKPVWKGR